MVKKAIKYYQVNPWAIIEKGFDPTRSMASESIFSLANEYMGVRGFFDEGYSGNSLIGTYFNGLYELPNKPGNAGYKGISKKSHFMVNSVNCFATEIYLNNQLVDLAKGDFSDFTRTLDMRSGELVRKYKYRQNDNLVEITFKRLLDMVNYTNAYQVIEIKVLEGKIDLLLKSHLDYAVKHFGSLKPWKIINSREIPKGFRVLSQTQKSKQNLYTDEEIIVNSGALTTVTDKKQNLSKQIVLTLTKDSRFVLEKRLSHLAFQGEFINCFEDRLEEIVKKRVGYEEALKSNKAYFQKKWAECDIEIEGDEENLQGIRFCIFNLFQTYRGISTNNIGAKGLTGEAYSGHAFWDTETYILPFYLFSDPLVAKKLLMFRYRTLPNAILRAKELDCRGACYPIATLNGDEACELWQHASLQFQPSTGVAFAIWHYVHLTKDYDFLLHYGAQMLVEISRFLASRGDWNPDGTGFGFYGVMGPDEFQMMVHNNTYTNYMAKRTFIYTYEVLKWMRENHPQEFEKLMQKCTLSENEVDDFLTKAQKMIILYDDNTCLFEQHDGFFKLPHIDKNTISVDEFPLYSHWSYDRLYRNDLIKQPDVLMMMFLYNQSFSLEQKRANYEFYEPKTIHESSLSPSIHSILAMELNKSDEALSFFSFATRLDLDDYNRNTSEGLHVTSLSAAWLNIVYGFGGLRSDGKHLKIAPKLPKNWERLKFKIQYRDRTIEVETTKTDSTVKVYGDSLELQIYDQLYLVDKLIKVKTGG
jgi:maltose phosphorylase